MQWTQARGRKVSGVSWWCSMGEAGGGNWTGYGQGCGQFEERNKTLSRQYDIASFVV